MQVAQMRAVHIFKAGHSGAALPGLPVPPNCLSRSPCISRCTSLGLRGWRDRQHKHACLHERGTRPLVSLHALGEAAAAAAEGEEAEARIVAVVPGEVLSQIGNTDVTLEEVLAHMGRRLAFNNPAFELRVFTDSIFQVTSLFALAVCLTQPDVSSPAQWPVPLSCINLFIPVITTYRIGKARSMRPLRGMLARQMCSLWHA